MPQSVLWDLLSFLLSPLHQSLNISPLSQASFSNLDYLDLEQPKFDISPIENLWRYIERRRPTRKTKTDFASRRRGRQRYLESRLRKR